MSSLLLFALFSLPWWTDRSPCSDLPQEKWIQLSGLQRALVEEESGLHHPRRFDQFLVRMDTARREWRKLAVRICPGPGTLELAARVDALIVEGTILWRDTIEAAADLREGQENELRLIGEMLKRSDRLSSASGFKIQASARELGVRLHQARRLWEQGRHDRVRELLEEMQELSQDLSTRLRDLRARYEDPARLAEWRQWALETARRAGQDGRPALVVDKYRRMATLYGKGKVIERFRVELGWNGMLDKRQQGDGATPEGRYRVVRRKGPGQTRYHRALLLDYPNDLDKKAFRDARSSGLLPGDARIGGLIEIHGDGGLGRDWTDGCVALENTDMDRLFAVAYEGMPVTVVGRITP